MRFSRILLLGWAPLLHAAGPLQLGLKRAVEIATAPEGNTRIQLAGEALKQAQSRAAEARAALAAECGRGVFGPERDAQSGGAGNQHRGADSGLPVPDFCGPV